uniref:NAD-capped RNA hydrolase DXO1-like n=1 Tax=Erigeron canadensis TaxID=72917 RepID=UPI001CB971C3|nr:NAD-capped RNA hydrolase DXO1-like [Erigeron canadensis]
MDYSEQETNKNENKERTQNSQQSSSSGSFSNRRRLGGGGGGGKGSSGAVGDGGQLRSSYCNNNNNGDDYNNKVVEEDKDLFGSDNEDYVNTRAFSLFSIPVLPRPRPRYSYNSSSRGGYGRGHCQYDRGAAGIRHRPDPIPQRADYGYDPEFYAPRNDERNGSSSFQRVKKQYPGDEYYFKR